MINGFSAIKIYVPELQKALADYEKLLGSFAGLPAGARVALSNVAIELQEHPGQATARIGGLDLWTDTTGDAGNSGATALPGDIRALPLGLTGDREVSQAPTTTGVRAVDHIVLRTRDADDCIRLFGDTLGMRLALDQLVPEWGGRMLFFRCGKLTLEVIQDLENPPERDHFWGITYLCPDLPGTLAILDSNGVQHSAPRDGRKPGTRVATVKSHTLGIPTLLIQPAG